MSEHRDQDDERDADRPDDLSGPPPDVVAQARAEPEEDSVVVSERNMEGEAPTG